MTLSDTKIRELEARGTTGSMLFATTALGLALIIAQHSALRTENEKTSIRLTGTESTVSISRQLNELDVFKQINRVYDVLLKNQVELDIDSKRALYANLWDLYT